MTLSYQETPVQEIKEKFIADAGLRLLLKREDLNHPYVSGNKWWKLKYNLQAANESPQKTVVTYGGAYSNHIFSTAAAASELGLGSIGIIRGEETPPLNPTLLFAKEKGMELRYISREAYRLKHEEYENFRRQGYCVIPEGGSNILAVKGVMEFVQKLGDDYDYLCCPVGTGGTLAGLVRGADRSKKIVGFSALKGGQFLSGEIQKLGTGQKMEDTKWQLMHDFHFGGYAKTTPELLKFIEQFYRDHALPLDFIYTGKMMAGIYDLIRKGFFPKGATILALHTGGLQSMNIPATINKQ
jgi:1-aminocyclopropane-1-carboxylate deaminase